MARTTSQRRDSLQSELEASFQAWLARLVLGYRLERTMVREGAIVDHDGLLFSLELNSLIGKKLSVAQLADRIRRRLRVLERGAAASKAPLFDNVRVVGDAVGLGVAERRLLAFAVACEVYGPLYDVLEELKTFSVTEFARALAVAVDVPPVDAIRALEPGSALLAGALISLGEPEQRRPAPIKLGAGLASLLLQPHSSSEALLGSFFRPSTPSKLSLADFPHAADELSLLTRMLSRGVEEKAAGLNVLLHGVPGTGKSELVRAVTASIHASLFEVRDQSNDGEPISADKRLTSYSLCQRMLATRERSLVLFDEIEDVFPSGQYGASKEATRGKAWINRLLEQNAVPAVWVSNEISQIDPAYLRRFSLVLELRAPPAPVRAQMLASALGESVSTSWIRAASEDDRLTPAHVATVKRAAALLRPASGREAEELLGRVLEGSLSAQGRMRTRRSGGAGLPYDLAAVTASHDLATLVGGLQATARGSICLYGLPGTGKTAFAEHVARKLERPLLARRASELLSCWVGGTEENIAEMFQQARAEKSVLFLDEADSFLRTRDAARASWEVTQVNELLVQMEHFDGIFICATNLFEALDPASLRRFNLKIKFEPPKPAQRWGLFVAAAASLGVGLDDEPTLRRRLDRIHLLTPGDVATVMKQTRLIGVPSSADELVSRLEKEVSLKPEARRGSLGFSLPGTQPTLTQAAATARD